MIKMLNEIETYLFFRMLASQIIFIVFIVGFTILIFVSEGLFYKIYWLIGLISSMMALFFTELQIRKIRNKLK